MLLRKNYQITEAETTGKFLGSAAKRAPSFPFMIIIKCLGAARGLAIPPNQSLQLPHGRATLPAKELSQHGVHQHFHQLENWFSSKTIGRLMVQSAAASWCSRGPPPLICPWATQGLVVNGTGGEAFCFPLTGCVNTDLLLCQVSMS